MLLVFEENSKVSPDFDYSSWICKKTVMGSSFCMSYWYILTASILEWLCRSLLAYLDSQTELV